MDKINKLTTCDRYAIAAHFANGNPFAAADYVRTRIACSAQTADLIADRVGREEGAI